MKISEVSRLTHTSIDTLRYYEKIGLIKPKRIGSHRDYQDSDLETLEFIRILKDATFSLDEIRLLIALDEQYHTLESIYQMNSTDIQGIKSLLSTKLKHIDQKISKLSTAQQRVNTMYAKMDRLSKGEIKDESNH